MDKVLPVSDRAKARSGDRPQRLTDPGERAGMNEMDVLRPGTEVDITVTSGWVTRTVASHIVHVVDVALYLTVPGPRDLSTVLPSGLPLTLYIKPDNGLYMARTQVLGYTKRGPLRLVVARPGALERVEHRRHVRVPVLIHPEQCEAHFGQSTGWFRISPTIINISAGGVLLRHYQLLAKGATLKMRFKLPNGYGPIRVEGYVLHGWMTEDHPYGPEGPSGPEGTDLPTYLMGVMFTRIATQDSEAIMRYVLEQERLASRQEQ